MTHLTAHSDTRLLQLATDHPLPVLAQWAVSFAVLITVWDQRARSRRALADLERAQLKDIGLTIEEARAEAHKSFWRP